MLKFFETENKDVMRGYQGNKCECLLIRSDDQIWRELKIEPELTDESLLRQIANKLDELNGK